MLPTPSQYDELTRLPLSHKEVEKGGRRRRTRLVLQKYGWAAWGYALGESQLAVTASGVEAMAKYKNRKKN